ncbi:MAG: hypothetical protein QXX91_01690 [Thermoplasmata archaeon]
MNRIYRKKQNTLSDEELKSIREKIIEKTKEFHFFLNEVVWIVSDHKTKDLNFEGLEKKVRKELSKNAIPIKITKNIVQPHLYPINSVYSYIQKLEDEGYIELNYPVEEVVNSYIPYKL